MRLMIELPLGDAATVTTGAERITSRRFDARRDILEKPLTPAVNSRISEG